VIIIFWREVISFIAVVVGHRIFNLDVKIENVYLYCKTVYSIIP